MLCSHVSLLGIGIVPRADLDQSLAILWLMFFALLDPWLRPIWCVWCLKVAEHVPEHAQTEDLTKHSVYSSAVFKQRAADIQAHALLARPVLLPAWQQCTTYLSEILVRFCDGAAQHTCVDDAAARDLDQLV